MCTCLISRAAFASVGERLIDSNDTGLSRINDYFQVDVIYGQSGAKKVFLSPK